MLCLASLACGGWLQASVQTGAAQTGGKKVAGTKTATPPPLKPAVQATSYLAQIYWPPPLCTSKFEQLCKSPQSILQILVPWATRRKYWGCCILEEGGRQFVGQAVVGKGDNKQPM